MKGANFFLSAVLCIMYTRKLSGDPECPIAPDAWVPCGYPEISLEECEGRGCCYTETEHSCGQNRHGLWSASSFEIKSPCVKQCGVQSDSIGECQTVNQVNPRCTVAARPCKLPPCPDVSRSAQGSVTNTSRTSEEGATRFTTTVVRKGGSKSWNIYTDASLSFCVSFPKSSTSHQIPLSEMISSAYACVTRIIHTAKKAYSYSIDESEMALFKDEGNGTFSTEAPFGYISQDPSKDISHLYYMDTDPSGALRLTRQDSRWTWVIRVREIHAMNLTVTRFQVAYSGEDCGADHMTMSEPQRVIGHYCGLRPPWAVETCSNELTVTFSRVSPEPAIVQMFYQVIDRAPGGCVLNPVTQYSGMHGRFTLAIPDVIAALSGDYTISWHILVDVWHSILLALPDTQHAEVYNGRLPRKAFLASPRNTVDNWNVFQSVGFHATVAVKFSYPLFYHVEILYKVIEPELEPPNPYCNYGQQGSHFHLEARNHYSDNFGNQFQASSIFCMLRVKTPIPLEIEIERMEFGSNSSYECLDSGLVIYDEYQEGLHIVEPQLGPLCGDRIQHLLRDTPKRKIITLGPKHGDQARNLRVAFYSYSVKASYFRAKLSRSECLGLFQPCVSVADFVKDEQRRIPLTHSELRYLVIRKETRALISIHVDVSMGDCLVFQRFPVFPSSEILTCTILVNSFSVDGWAAANVDHSGPYWFIEPVQANLFYNFGPNFVCPYCYDIAKIFAMSFNHRQIHHGEGNLTLHEAFSLYYFPRQVTVPSAFRLVLATRYYVDAEPVPNVHLFVGSNAATLRLPWITGYYKIAFHQRQVLFYKKRNLCDSVRFFFFHMPKDADSGSSRRYVISHMGEKRPLHTWVVGEDVNDLVWISRFDKRFSILINFPVSEISQNCSTHLRDAPFKLYYFNLPQYTLSSADTTASRRYTNCRLSVPFCRFGKCFNFGQPVKHLNASWDYANNFCNVLGKRLPSLVSAEESNWLRSIINIKFKDIREEFFGYISIYLNLYRKQGDTDWKWDGHHNLGYAEWNSPIQHRFAPTSSGWDRKAFEAVKTNLTQRLHPTPESHNCAAALLINQYVSLQWVAVPCSLQLPNVLMLCQEPYLSQEHELPIKHNNRTDRWRWACPTYFVSGASACFTMLPDIKNATGVFHAAEFQYHPELLTTWGVSFRGGRLFVQYRKRLAMLVPKLLPWLQNMSTWYHMLPDKLILDIIPLSQSEQFLLQTEFISTDSCMLKMHFRCPSGECILFKFVCDGIETCPHGEDEDDCETNFGHITENLISGISYSHRMWKCDIRGYVPLLKVCDFHIDCEDGSDEALCTHPACTEGGWRCDNGQCIPSTESCDLKVDCLDNSDEIECDQRKMNAFLCDSGDYKPTAHVHDLWPDCQNAEDEDVIIKELESWHSLNILMPSPCNPPNLLPCMLGTTACYPTWAACLFEHDEYGVLSYCRNGAHLSNCTEMQCVGTFKCPESYCLPLHKVCDGQNDCFGGADEVDCEEYTCPVGSLACVNSILCVHHHQLCDGIRHCPYADDEEYCSQTVCPTGCVCQHDAIDCRLNDKFPPFGPYFRDATIMGDGTVLEGILQMPYVTHLNISNAKFRYITDGTFSQIPNVASLYVGGDSEVISSRSFTKLRRIKFLRLDRNPIRHIEPYGLSGMPTLVSLNLSQTRVVKISDDILDGLSSLKFLFVASSPLQYISSEVLILGGLRVLDIRETSLLVAGHTIDILAQLPIDAVMLSNDPVLCMIAEDMQHPCQGQEVLPRTRVVPHIGFVVVVTVLSVASLPCTITSLAWHCRYLSIPHSLLAFHLSFAELGILLHSLVVSAQLLHNEALGSSLLRLFLWGTNWPCYMVMTMVHVAHVLRNSLLCLFSLKRWLAIVRPLDFNLLRTAKLRSYITSLWFFSGVVGSVLWIIHLSVKVVRWHLTGTFAFCFAFTHAQEFGVYIEILFAVQLTVDTGCIIAVIVTSGSLIKSIIGRKRLSETKSKHLTKTQIVKVTCRLVLEVGIEVATSALGLLAFSYHKYPEDEAIALYLTEVAVLAQTARSFSGFVFWTYFSVGFRKALCMIRCCLLKV